MSRRPFRGGDRPSPGPTGTKAAPTRDVKRPAAAPRSAVRAPQPSRGDGVWIYGLHAVTAALDNSARVCRRLLATEEGVQRLAPTASGRPHPIAPEIVGRETIDAALPPGAVHQGLALLAAPLPMLDVSDLLHLSEGVASCQIVALDQVTDPQNVGAVLRSAAAFGALGVMLPDRHAPEETGALAKAASGALERVPVIRVTNLVRALEELKAAGFWAAGLDAEGDRTLAEAGLTGKTVLVLGAEGSGLRRLTRETCDYQLRLPMRGGFESLNVSNAAAIALYELNRG